MSKISMVGIDLAKSVFQVHGADSSGAVRVRKKLRRNQVLAFFATLPRYVSALTETRYANIFGFRLRLSYFPSVHFDAYELSTCAIRMRAM